MLRNILAVIVGVLVGMSVNMGIIILGENLIPIPEGFDPMDATNWELSNFIFPFLAHALGTVAGALVASLIAVSYRFPITLSISVFFLIGGVTMVFLLPAPVWFICTDLIVAYIPMGYLGYSLVAKRA